LARCDQRVYLSGWKIIAVGDGQSWCGRPQIPPQTGGSMTDDDLTEWARREAAKLPPRTDEQAAEVGRLAAKIDAHQASVEAAPPLTPEQREPLALLLHPGT
jgi:hypothetical protein